MIVNSSRTRAKEVDQGIELKLDRISILAEDNEGMDRGSVKPEKE